MKATGIVRSVDNLGRIVVPKEIIRRELGWTDGTPIEVFIDDEGEGVVLRTYDPDHMRALQTVREEYWTGSTLDHGSRKRLKSILTPL